MKKIISIILILTLFTYLCGCQKPQTDNKNSQPSDTANQNESNLPEVSHPLDDDNNDKNSQTTNGTSSTGPTICPPAPNNRLPVVKFSTKDSDVKFTDIVSLPNGGFAVSGYRYTETKIESIIQIYDKNVTLKKEYTYYDSISYDKIAVCTDGGYITTSQNGHYLTKISSDFKIEWSTLCEKDCDYSVIHDIEEISPEVIAVLYITLDSIDFSRRLRISYFNKDGTFIETIDLMENIDPQDANIIADGNGGFYLLFSCSEELAEKYPLVAEEYDNSKANEAIIMHFSAKRELKWIKILGGSGNDWIEESIIDNDGNFYLAVGTNWYGTDSFWEMSFDRSMPYRRMLVKLDKNGNLVYKIPLSNKGMAVDHIFGIHIKNGKTYVVGMADYFDGYQSKYPCEQISKAEKGERVFCVYTVCIDSNGEELDRKIFRCDINNEPCDSEMLSNGNLVIAGRVSCVENPFNLNLPSDFDTAAAFYVYN